MQTLQSYLRAHALSDQALAQRVGVHTSTINRIRRGRQRLTPDLARKVEAATDGHVTAASLLGADVPAVEPPYDLGDKRWVLYPDAHGRLMLTPELVRDLGFEVGERLMLRARDGVVDVTSPDQHLRAVQEAFARRNPSGKSYVDELIADRQAEAAAEA